MDTIEDTGLARGNGDTRPRFNEVAETNAILADEDRTGMVKGETDVERHSKRERNTGVPDWCNRPELWPEDLIFSISRPFVITSPQNSRKMNFFKPEPANSGRNMIHRLLNQRGGVMEHKIAQSVFPFPCADSARSPFQVCARREQAACRKTSRITRPSRLRSCQTATRRSPRNSDFPPTSTMERPT